MCTAATLGEMGGGLRVRKHAYVETLIYSSIAESSENNNKCVFECFYQWSLSIADSYLSSQFPKQSQASYIKFGWPFDRFLLAYRSTPQTTIGVTSAELLVNHCLRTRLNLIRPKPRHRVETQLGAHDIKLNPPLLGWLSVSPKKFSIALYGRFESYPAFTKIAFFQVSMLSFYLPVSSNSQKMCQCLLLWTNDHTLYKRWQKDNFEEQSFLIRR